MANDTTINIKVGQKEKFKDDLEETESLVKKFGDKLKTIGAVVAAAWVVNFVKNSMAGWIEEVGLSEKAAAKLAAQVEVTGGKAGWTADQLNKLGQEISNMTGITTDQISQAQSLILTLENVRGDELRRATIAAADLAVTLGTDVPGAAKTLGVALDDPVNQLGSLEEAGIRFTEAQKEMIAAMAQSGDIVGAQDIILSALEERFGGVANAVGDTFAGKLDKFRSKAGELGKSLATMFIPVLEAIMPAAELAMKGLQLIFDGIIGLQDKAGEFGESFTDKFMKTFKSVVEYGVDTFSMFLSFYDNFSMSVEHLTYSWFRTLTTTFEDMSYQLTEVIPQYLTWLSENWTNIFTDIAAFTGTVLSNLGKNLKAFWTNVYNMLTGGEWSWEWTALTAGFESTLKELPNIAERELTETERYLDDAMSQLDKRMQSNYEARHKAGREFLEKMFAESEAAISEYETTASTDYRPVGVQAPEEAAAEKEALAAKAATSGEEKSSAGQVVGLEDLHKRTASMQDLLAADQAAAEASLKDVADSSETTVDYTSVLTQILQKFDKQIDATTKSANTVKDLNMGLI